MTSPTTLQREDFSTLDVPLQAVLPTGNVALAVRSTSALPAHALREAPFSVILQGPAEQPLAQGMFAIEHPLRGRIEIFLVPIARTATAIDYEAVFN